MTDGACLIIERTLDAPRELVWQTWTDPDHIAKWWGPRCLTTRVETLDLQVGGHIGLVMINADGQNYPMNGVYQEIVPMTRLVMTDEFGEGFQAPDGGSLPRSMIMTVEFAAIDANKTLLRLTIQHRSPEDLARHKEMLAVEGWNSSIDCLEEYLSFAGADGLALHLVRHFRAPRSLLWSCWSQREHRKSWFLPSGYDLLNDSSDFREAGMWSLHMRSPEGNEYRMRGFYREIVPQERLVFTQAWLDDVGRPQHETIITVTLSDEDMGTRLDFQQAVFRSQAMCESHVEGWEEVLDNLHAHLNLRQAA